MEGTKRLSVILISLSEICFCSAQVSSGTILDVLTRTNGLRTFGSWCQETFPEFYSGAATLTVFAFNDTSYNYNSPSSLRTKLRSLTPDEKREYVRTYTMVGRISLDQMRDSSTLQSINGMELFINKRNRVYWSPGSTTGSASTYVNGAMIIREQLQASNGIIHVLDRPLDLVSDKNVYQWLMEPDDPTIQTTTWRDLAAKLYQDSRYFLQVITPLARTDKVTLFIPSETALRKIPASKIQGLQGEELAKYFKMHFILNRVVYTSCVEHQESYETGQTGSRLLLMRQDANRVLVKSGGVTAMIERGNITVRNGVIHIIDTMLGFVYNSAREQIKLDAPTFNRLIDRVSPELQSLINQPSGVNVFVPTENAFTHIQNLRGVNLKTNSSLVDFLVRLCMVRDGSVEVSQIHGNYDMRQRRYTRYGNWTLVIYNDKNESWVNGGNVRARIVRPDVKVTTGYLQYIDAVLGVPSMDIPTLISYDNFLIYTYNDLKMTGLDDYLKDQSFDSSYLPPRSFDHLVQQNTGQKTGSSYYGTCGSTFNICQFTVFIPNGTAIINYHMTSLGNQITKDVPRYRYVLRRHIIPNQLIFIDKMPISSQSYRYKAHNGDEIVLRKEAENYVRLSWSGMSARIIMSDLGGTNGVVHIIDTVLSQLSDRDVDI